jgi:hypothetical protein
VRQVKGQHVAEGCRLIRRQIEKARVGTRSRTAGWSDAAKRLSITSIQGGTDPYQSRVRPIRPKSGRHVLLAKLVWVRIKTNH